MTPDRHETVAAVSSPSGAGADAVGDLVAAVDGVALSGAMSAWLDDLAMVFADWHEDIVEALERHPALDPAACWERPSTVPAGYRDHIAGLVHGIGAGTDIEAGPLATPLLELDPSAFRDIHAASVVIPPPLGSPSGLTGRFVAGVHSVVDAVAGPGLGADDVRRHILEYKGRGFAALDRLRIAAATPTAIAS